LWPDLFPVSYSCSRTAQPFGVLYKEKNMKKPLIIKKAVAPITLVTPPVNGENNDFNNNG
jgi:hypothetical protein